MEKIIFNTRDELVCVDVNMVAADKTANADKIYFFITFCRIRI